MGFFDGIANAISDLFSDEYSSPPIRVPVPEALVFKNWMKQLAASYGADLHWDEDGGTCVAFGIPFQGDYRTVVVILNNGELYVAAPSGIKFASGCLPREVAAVLADRNRKVSCGGWDIVDNGQTAYFTFKGHVRMHQTNVAALKGDIDKMLTESYAVDRTLEDHGYVR